jgi:hypothetical protein
MDDIEDALNKTRPRLLANTTYNVGSGQTYSTIQAALDAIAAVDLNGFIATVQLADGTYTTGGLCDRVWAGAPGSSVVIKGNAATPANVIISTTSANAIQVQDGAVVTVKDLELRTTTLGDCFYVVRAGKVFYQNVRFGACAGFHMNIFQGGHCESTGNYAITGGAVAHMHAAQGGKILNSSNTVTITGTPAFSSFFIGVAGPGMAQCIGQTYSGSATGKRYLVHNNGFIDLGDSGASATYFPGDAAGETETYGVYDYTTPGSLALGGSFAASGAPLTSPMQWLVEADNGVRSAYLSSQVRIEATNKAQDSYRVLALYGSSVYLGSSGTASFQVTSAGIAAIAPTAINGAPLTADSMTGLTSGTATSGKGWRWTSVGSAPSLQSVTYSAGAVAGYAALGIAANTLNLSGDNGSSTNQLSLSSGLITVASGNTVAIADTTDAASSTSAPLKSAGGIAAAKKIYSGTGFYGDGANITGLDAGNVSAGTLAVARGGTGAATARAAAAALKVPYVLASSGVQVTHTGDTAEFVLATISIPANSMGANGRLRILTHWSYTNSANSKSLRVRWGGSSGTVCSSQSVTTTAAFGSECFVQNRNATNSQVCGMTVSSGLGTGTINTASQDTTGAIDLVITGQLTNSAESVNLEGYCVELIVP